MTETVKQVSTHFGPSERLTVDFSDLDHSTLNIVNGQSGNIFDEHYDDQMMRTITAARSCCLSQRRRCSGRESITWGWNHISRQASVINWSFLAKPAWDHNKA
jgi:hypothetical protein